MAKVALVQMPYAMTAWPSLGLSILKAGLQERNISCTIHYLTKWYEASVGEVIYNYMATGAPVNTALLGEWTFSEALWGQDPARDEAYFAEVLCSQDKRSGTELSEKVRAEARDHAMQCRSHVDAFLARVLDEIDWMQYEVVGFTSVFQQHAASLALARLLKARFPHLFIIMGGANCEAEMGSATMRCFPFIDAVCRGEGDDIFPQLVEGVLSQNIVNIDGILLKQQPRSDELFILTNAAREARPIVDLNSLPYPDFDDFFVGPPKPETADSLRLVFETSRGCWWGQKHHCTFCGLNGNGMQFRYKSAARAMDELDWILSRYGSHTRSVYATDNIMPYEYFHSFLPELAERQLGVDFFYETKANLKHDQLALYKQAGLSRIQPGIESLNTHVLGLMGKGITALQNIQLIKLCFELGIQPEWNYIFGFPGEEPAWYSQQTTLIGKMLHLAPPRGCARVRFDRFSPYLNEPAKFGLSDLQPYPAYGHIYRDLSPQDISDLAYYFTATYKGDSAISEYTAPVVDSIRKWQSTQCKTCLYHQRSAETTVIYDSRQSDEVRVVLLKGLHHVAASLCDEITTFAELKRKIGGTHPEWALPGQIEEVIGFLEERNLVITENDRILGLSVSLGSATPVAVEVLTMFEELFAKQRNGMPAEEDVVTFRESEFEVVGN